MDDLQIIIYILFGLIYLLLQIFKKKKPADGETIAEENEDPGSMSFEDWMDQLEGKSKAAKTEEVGHWEEKPYTAERKNRQMKEEEEEDIAQRERERAEKQSDSIRETKEQVLSAKDSVKERVEQKKKEYKSLVKAVKKERKPLREGRRSLSNRKKPVNRHLKTVDHHLKAKGHYKEKKGPSSDVIDDIRKDPSWARKAVIYSEIINKKYD